jgi:hypothetical protein
VSVFYIELHTVTHFIEEILAATSWYSYQIQIGESGFYNQNAHRNPFLSKKFWRQNEFPYQIQIGASAFSIKSARRNPFFAVEVAVM